MRVYCDFVEVLSLFFQAWYASCYISLSDWYVTWNVDGITLGIDVGTYLGSLYGSLDGSNDGKLEGLLRGGSLGYTNGKVLGSDEGIKLRLSGGKVLGTIPGNVYGITLGLDVGTELSLFIYPFMVLMMVNLEGLLLGDSLEYTHSKVIGSDEGTKLELSGEMFLQKIKNREICITKKTSAEAVLAYYASIVS